MAKELTWRFTLEPLLDREPIKKSYTYVVPDPQDDLDIEDVMAYVTNDFAAAIKRFKEDHREHEKEW